LARQRRHKKTAKQAPAKTAAARIGDIGARGDGVAVVGDARVFVPLTAPGDVATISYSGQRGEVEALIEPSPDRGEAICPYFGACGGCALQHLDTDYYRRWKRNLVVEALGREGFAEEIVAPLVSCPPASRRRATFAARKTAKGVVFGFNARRSATIVDIDRCPVLAPELEKALPALRALADAAPARWRAFDLAVTLCDNGVDASFAGGDAADDLTGAEIMALTDKARAGGVTRLTVEGAPVASFEAPVVRFAGVPVTLPPGGFLQASREGEAALTEFVVKNAEGAKRVADLFSGCGTFSLPLAKDAAVDAFDSDAPAIAALDAAARAAGFRHPLKAELRNLFERPLRAEELRKYDAVVFDPPRAGAEAQAAELARSEVAKIIGVSCSPASFARDAGALRAGGYRLSQVVPVDQFVFSPHVEIAGLFTKG
jgi:23S rRNA (uracil1939-C5)-methyltransferase